MPDPPVDLTELEEERSRLYGDLSQVGDFRRGGLHAVRRRCGKANCACADPGHLGHGPQYNFTRSVAGKTVNVHLKPGPELDKVEGEVANYERFRSLVAQVTEVNEAICEARPVEEPSGEAPGQPGPEKGGSSVTSRRSSPRS
ncbi:MAG: DUF6788 family protein [Acidimicrobiales bacterium]